MRPSAPSELRVTMVAMTVGYGSAPYVQLLPEALSPHACVSLLVPSHMKDHIANVNVVPFRTGTTPSHALRQSIKPWSHFDLITKVRRTTPHVVHILNGHGYPWSLALAAFMRPVPIVTTLHDPTPHPGNRTDAVNAITGRYTLSRSAVIHVHDEMFVAPIARRFPDRRIVVIRHGSFASRYLRHFRPGIARTRSILLFGRIEPYKGIPILLRAIQKLPADVSVTVAGAGALSAEEQSLAIALGPRLTLINRFLEDDEAALLLQQAGVLALPYLHATQSSLPLIAAAFGLPVVASAVGTFISEVPYLGGVLVPPCDSDALAVALASQLESPMPIRNEQVSFDTLVPQFLDLYRWAVG